MESSTESSQANPLKNPLRIAVTGGSGRVGWSVAKGLVDRGHQVINLDRRQAEHPVARFFYCDVTKREQLQSAFENIDAVIHLAEIPHAHAPFSPDYIFSHNTTAGPAVMQTAIDKGIRRVIYTSSCQVYGMWGYPNIPPLTVPMDETHPVQPSNVYALSKVANESYARWLAKASGASIAIMRLPSVWPAYADDGWLKWADRQEGQTEGFSSFLHSSDAGSAYVAAVENVKPGCEAYHFTAADVTSSQPLRDRLKARNPDYPPLPADWPDFKCPVNCDKARDHLGWVPKWSFRENYLRVMGEKSGK